MLRRATAFLLCALMALPPQTAAAATAVFRVPTPSAQSTTPVVMSANVPVGRVDDPYVASFRGTGGTSPYTYELISGTVPSGTIFNPETGDISGTPPVSGSYPGIKVRVTDRAGATATSNTYTITIAGRPLSLTTSIPLSGVVGQPYTAAITAKGGAKPVAFTVYSGSLPEGLFLDTTTGVISGTPIARGTSTFSIRALDSTKPSSFVATTAMQSISVDYAPLSVTCPPCGGAQTAVGNSFDVTFSASGGRGPYLFYVQQGVLPPGLVLDRDTGRLTGTPTKPGLYPDLIVQAVDQDNRYVLTPAFEIGVQATVAVSGAPAPRATVGEAYVADFTAAGGQEPYAWTLIGSLPPGLMLDAASGAISGTPTQVGSYAGLQVRASDAQGRTAVSNPFAISVATPVALAGSVGDATVGQDYLATFTASGGRAPYVFSIAAGDLPPGLSFGTGGVLAGTPTQAGAYPGLVVRATDADGRTATRGPLTVSVLDRMGVSGTMPLSGTVGEAYDASFAATGGRGPYSWSVSGSLPTGLVLSSSTGEVSGRPNAVGTYSGISIVARDVDGRTASAGPFSVGVADLLRLTVDVPPARYATAGERVATSTFRGLGGSVPYAYTLQGELPDGLSYDAVARTISGTPTTAGRWAGIVAELRDSQGRTAQLGPYTIDVATPVSVAAAPPTAMVGESVDYAADVSGGVGPYTCVLKTGQLPPGLRVDTATCHVVGTPTAAGAYPIAIAATDSQGRVGDSQPYEWSVRDPLRVRGTPAAFGTVGSVYSAEFDAVGGEAPYAWTLSGGTLPAGLVLDATSGSIAGAPTASGLASGLVVEATDAVGRKAVSAPFSIDVRARLTIAGNPASEATVGQAYSATFAALGGRSPYIFALVEGGLPAGLTLSSSGILSGTPTSTGRATDLRVRVTDAEGRIAATEPFSIAVAADLRISGAPASMTTVGEAYDAVFTAFGGTSPYSWIQAAGTLPAGLVLDGATGTISGTAATAGTATGLQVRATDAFGRTALSATFSIDVRAPLAISGTPAPYGTIGRAYAATFEVAGGRSAYVFSLAAGSLPVGLSLSASGAISGSPTVAGMASGLRVQVSDADGRIAVSEPFAIDVSENLSVSGTPATKATVGETYSAPFAAVGGTGPYAWAVSAGSLPDGLVIDDATGEVSGTPTAAGVFQGIQVRAADAVGRTALSKVFQIDVRVPLAIEGVPLPVATVGSAYASAFTAVGGRGSYVFSLAAGTLPTGLALSPSGAISGSPSSTGVSAGLEVRVTDADGRTAVSGPFSIAVSDGLVVGGTPPGSATVGEAYSASFSAAGGSGRYDWSLKSGQLPAGLKLDAATGTISGFPSEAVFATGLAVRAADTDGRTADSATFSISVRDRLEISGMPSSHATVGQSYSASYIAFGGRAPYAFTVVAGQFPRGIVLSSSGTISGTPTDGGDHDGLQVRVTDADGRIALATPFSIKVATSVLVSGDPQTFATVGQAYTASFMATGGTAPFTWELAAGTLPTSLSVTSSGAVVGTPATAGTFAGLQVRATDAVGRTGLSHIFSISVGQPLQISGTPAGTATVGTAYAATFTAAGGRAPYVFGPGLGTLPAGLSISSGGVLSGAPIAVETRNDIQVRAVDADGRIAYSAPFRIAVSDPLTISGLPPAQVTIGDAYIFDFQSSGGVRPHAFSLAAGSLPAGLTLSSTGRLAGAPTTAGTAGGLQVKATDAEGRTATTPSFSISVSAPLVISGTPSATATLGQAYGAQFAATGGHGPYVFAVSGTLPDGIALDGSSGRIAGIPTIAGTYGDIVITVRDVDGRTASAQPFTLVVTGGLSASGNPARSVVVDERYVTEFVAAGGTDPYTFALGNGVLPPGLELTVAGTLEGVANTVGTYAFRVQATDANGITALSPQYAIEVVPALRLVGSLPRNWDYGAYMEYRFTAAGGRGPYVFSADPSKPLPAGIMINSSTGTVSGTPSARGEFLKRSIFVTDADGHVASGDWTVSVWDPIRAWVESIPSGTVGTPYTLVLRCSGPQLGCDFASKATASKLPPGLEILSSRAEDRFAGQISGTPSQSGVYGGIGIRVTDANDRSTDIDDFAIDVRERVTVDATWVDAGMVGQPYSAQIRVSGGRSPIVFSIATGALPAGITLDPDSGRVAGSPTEAVSLSGISFMATDPDGRTGLSPIYALTTYLPLTISGSPAGMASVGSAYSAQFTASGGHAPYTFTLLGSLPDGLSLSSATGLISGTPTTSAAVQGLFVVATDADGRKASSPAFSITVGGPLAIAGTPAPTARLGSAYTATFAASGGTDPYAFSLATGALPAGLSLSPEGRITGSPTETGVFTFAVRVSDAASSTATTGTFSLDVRAGAEPLTIGAYSIMTGTVGESFYSRYFGAGGTQPYSYRISQGALPDGLILSDQGNVVGIPTKAGSFTFRVQVADAAAQTAETADQTIKVTGPLELTQTYLDIDAYVGDSGDLALPVRGGTPPYTLLVIDGDSVIPPGLALDDGSLRVTGRYTASNDWSVQWKLGYAIVDAEGRGTPKGTIYWRIRPALNLEGTLDPVYVKGVRVTNYWYNGSASVPGGGRSPWTLSYEPIGAGAQLPPGFVEGLQYSGGSYYGWPGHPGRGFTDDYGAIYWTPSAVGTYGPVRTTIRDAEGRTKHVESGVINVVDPLTWQTALPEARRGQPYSVDVRQSGGAAPFAYKSLSGVLPEGLTLDAATGIISGTVTGAAGTYTKLQFSVDWAGGWFRNTTSPVYALTVVDPDNRPRDPLGVAVVGSNPPARNLTGMSHGQPSDYEGSLSRVFKASGGTPPYTFSLSPGIENMPMVCDPNDVGCSDDREADAAKRRSALTVDQQGVFRRLQSGYDSVLQRTLYKDVPTGRIRNIRIRVTDSLGDVADSASFDMDFQKPASLAGAFPANLTVGDAVDVLGTALDGWEAMVLTEAQLPPGLNASISGRGVRISGTVTAAGRYVDQFVAIRDDYPLAAAWRFSTTVHQPMPPLALAAPADTTAVSGDFVSIAWTPSGGFPPYRVTLRSGALPPGLDVDYRGIGSGTVMGEGAWTDIVAEVQDSSGATALARPLKMEITSAPTDDEFCDGYFCPTRFTAGPWPVWGPMPPGVPARSFVEALSPYIQADGITGWPCCDKTREDRIGPNAGDPSYMTFEFMNAPSWLKWSDQSVVFAVDDMESEWLGYIVNGYYNRRSLVVVPPPIEGAAVQSSEGLSQDHSSGGTLPGDG